MEPFVNKPSLNDAFLKLIPFIPSPSPDNANDIAEFTSTYSFILTSFTSPCTKYGFNISHFTFPKYSWKYKSILFTHESVPVIYTLFIVSVLSFIIFCTCPTILYNVGIISSKYPDCSACNSLPSDVYIVVFLNIVLF